RGVWKPVSLPFPVQQVPRVALDKHSFLGDAVRTESALRDVDHVISGRLVQELLALGAGGTQEQAPLVEYPELRISRLLLAPIDLRHRAIAAVDGDVSVGITPEQVEGEQIGEPVEPSLVGQRVLRLTLDEPLIRDQADR